MSVDEKIPLIDKRKIVIGFALFMFIISAFFYGGKIVDNPVIKKIGKTEIKYTDLFKYYHMIEFDDEVDKNSIEFKNYLYYKAIEIATMRAYLIRECELLGLKVTPEMVLNSIKNDEKFLDDNSEFCSEKLDLFLQKYSFKGNNFTELEYKAVVKENLLIDQWKAIIGHSYKIPDSVIEAIALSNSQKRNIRYFVIDHNEIADPEISDEELLNFYKTNKHKFKTEVKKIFEFCEIDKKNIENSELNIANVMLGKDNFEAVVKRYKLEIKNSEKDYISEELLDGISKNSMQIDECTQILVFDGQYCFFKLKKIIQSQEKEFKEVKKEVKKLFVKEYKLKKAILDEEVEWKYAYDLKLNEKNKDVNKNITNFAFSSILNETIRYDINDYTYYIIVDSIENKKLTKKEFDESKKNVNEEFLKNVLSASSSNMVYRN